MTRSRSPCTACAAPSLVIHICAPAYGLSSLACQFLALSLSQKTITAIVKRACESCCCCCKTACAALLHLLSVPRLFLFLFSQSSIRESLEHERGSEEAWREGERETWVAGNQKVMTWVRLPTLAAAAAACMHSTRSAQWLLLLLRWT